MTYQSTKQKDSDQILDLIEDDIKKQHLVMIDVQEYGRVDHLDRALILFLEGIGYRTKPSRYLPIEGLEERMKIAENQLEYHENEINNIINQIKNIKMTLDKNVFKKDDSIPLKFRKNEDFIKEQDWIREKKNLHPNEIILYKKEGSQSRLLASSASFESLKYIIDDLIDKKIISEKEKVYFA